MAVRLSGRSFEFAKKLIDERCVVLDVRDDWSEHQPSAQQENEFIQEMDSVSTGGRIWVWTMSTPRTTSPGTSFPTATSRTRIDADSSPRRRGARRESTPTSRARRRTCTACT